MPANSAHYGPQRRLIAAIAGISIAITALLSLDLSDYRSQAIDKAK